MRGLCAPTAPTARVASARALRGRGARRSPPLRAVSPRAQAASWGGDEGNKDEWRAHGKQIVEALTRGSSLARAASVWFVDRRADDGASTSAAAAPASFATPGEIQRFGARTDDAADDVLRVDARRESLPRRALAHPESRENREVRAALERHLASGGATVLLAPIVDPLIVDLSADADRDAAATFDEAAGSSDDPNDGSAPPRTRSGMSSGSFVRFDATWKNGDERGVFVEGTACACDPNDPGDCCARGLSEYCTTCPTLASCDESLDGLGGDGLTVGSSVDRDPPHALSPLRSTDALESLEALRAACAAATRTGDCAFSEAIKDEVSRKGERPENAGRTYYAAVVRTRDVGRSDEKNGEETSDASLESAWNDDASAFSAEALADAGYEQFLVYRPNGDAWLAGSVPPPTTVRRASFGPKLRAELWSLARRGGR
jgi:hypothetical protein